MSIVNFDVKGNRLVARVSGDVDQHTCGALRRQIDRELDVCLPSVLELNMSGVSFMDSSGIGLIMGRYKKMDEGGGRLVLSGVRENCRRIVAMSGVTKILDIEEEDL